MARGKRTGKSLGRARPRSEQSRSFFRVVFRAARIARRIWRLATKIRLRSYGPRRAGRGAAAHVPCRHVTLYYRHQYFVWSTRTTQYTRLRYLKNVYVNLYTVVVKWLEYKNTTPRSASPASTGGAKAFGPVSLRDGVFYWIFLVCLMSRFNINI
jgi:hypothetical protein